MHRTRHRTNRAGIDVVCERSPRVRYLDRGDSRVVEPANGRPVQRRLIDRLRRTDVAQLGRTIRRAHDQRNRGEMGFDDCCVKVGRCGTRSAQRDGRRSADQRRTQCRKGGASLVEKHLSANSRLGDEGQGHRRRTRTRGHERMLHPEPHPLVDQRRTERCLCVCS